MSQFNKNTWPTNLEKVGGPGTFDAVREAAAALPGHLAGALRLACCEGEKAAAAGDAVGVRLAALRIAVLNKVVQDDAAVAKAFASRRPIRDVCHWLHR